MLLFLINLEHRFLAVLMAMFWCGSLHASDEWEETREAINLDELNYDRTIFYHGDASYSLGIIREVDGERIPIQFKFNEIRPFLLSERHKNIIVIQFDKALSVTDPNSRGVVLKKIREDFKQVGYKKIYLVEMTNGGPVSITW